MRAYKVTMDFLVMAEDEHIAITRVAQYVADPSIQSVQHLKSLRGREEIKVTDVNVVLHSEGPF